MAIKFQKFASISGLCLLMLVSSHASAYICTGVGNVFVDTLCDADEISADEIAAWMETISYEVLCLFGTFNERVYL